MRAMRIVTIATLTMACACIAAPLSAVAAPPAEGNSPPAAATSFARYERVAQDYVGVAFIRFICDDTPNDSQAAQCIAPPPTVLTYRRSNGTWIVDRLDRHAAERSMYLTKQYSGNWMWIWNPSLGLRVIARVELARLA